MMEYEYVIIINRTGPIPLRHIIKLNDLKPYYEEDFKKWYYDQYCKLDGDEFIHCKNRKERDKFLETIK